ncbi:MAG: hypothetical protein RMM53_09230, partial [Bacteroidia bacterium]|nr:hypothetical protein [Bacteroidia bacterium]MDW8334383.1 hypothetical protein [Bacteroidia bacterium]
KACRGPLSYVYGEYAWGTAGNVVEAINITTPENGTEICTDLNANLHYYGSNVNVVTGSATSQGPLGVGIFARDTTIKRISTGAAYYGAMEMSGNVAEVVITIRGSCGSNNVSCYTGIWGDGELNADMLFDVPGWPTAHAGGFYTFVYRGGDWNDDLQRCRVSDRYYSNWVPQNPDTRGVATGGRGCR